jgi:hypothetical protein
VKDARVSGLEREITDTTDLCEADGRLNPAAVGWSRHPVHTCNLPDSLARKKKWNYWAVTDGDLMLSVTVADIERLQLAGVYLYHRPSNLLIETTVTHPANTIVLPNVTRGDIMFDHPHMRAALIDDGTGTRIQVQARDVGGSPLEADILVERPSDHETLNVVVPWSDVQYQYTSKQNTLPASGFVRFQGEHHELADSFGCLDYGRGVWPKHTMWNWGSASATQNGRVVGLNLGGQWTDGTGMTENGICIDGRLTKFSEDLTFQYDSSARMQPWRVITAASDRVDLLFQPEFERVSETGRRDGFFVSAHQMFGTYAGRVTPDSGDSVIVRDMFGWIEDHEAVW